MAAPPAGTNIRPTGRRCRLLRWTLASAFLFASIPTLDAFALVQQKRLAPSLSPAVGRSMSPGVLGESGRTGLCMASQDEFSEGDVNESSSMSTPLDRPLLAAVDALALLAFAGIGTASHHGTGGVAGDGGGIAGALQVVGTALPFLVAWFAVSPVAGAYQISEGKDDRRNLIRDTVVQTAPGWAVAIPLGCVLRGVVRGYAPPLPFVAVALVATLILLCAGRVAFSVLEDFFVQLV